MFTTPITALENVIKRRRRQQQLVEGRLTFQRAAEVPLSKAVKSTEHQSGRQLTDQHLSLTDRMWSSLIYPTCVLK